MGYCSAFPSKILCEEGYTNEKKLLSAVFMLVWDTYWYNSEKCHSYLLLSTVTPLFKDPAMGPALWHSSDLIAHAEDQHKESNMQ